MPGGLAAGLEVCNGLDYGTATASSAGITVTPSATANTKGSFVQLSAFTTADISAIHFTLYNSNFGPYLLDIAIGAAGSEKVIVNNVALGSGDAVMSPGVSIRLPLHIPKGSRISARCQSGNASDSPISLGFQAFDGATTMMEGCAGADGIGAITTTSRGTAVTAGSANTKGSYAQLIALAARDYMGFYFSNRHC